MAASNKGVPCPFPAGFNNAPPKASMTNDVSSNEGTLDGSFPPKGNGQNATDDFYDSIWNVPDGRRGK